MRVELLVPDVAPDAPGASPLPAAGGTFGALVDAAGGVLARADAAESAFAAHRGGLQEMVVERARADIALQTGGRGGAARRARVANAAWGCRFSRWNPFGAPARVWARCRCVSKPPCWPAWCWPSPC